MSYPVYYVPAGDVLPVLFDTFDGGTGASITMTGLAVTDIEIYKDGGKTQRASDAGYTLLDTDGIDFDGVTGIHGFSIDTGDNTDSGFYAVGSWYHVVVSSVTVDSQTVNFIACAFRIMVAESVAGAPKVDVHAISADTTAADNAELMFDGTGYAGGTTKLDVNVTSIAANAITATAINADAITEAKIADNAFANEHFAAGALTSTEITSAAGCAVASIAANAITATAIAADAIEAAKIKDDAITAAKIAANAIDAATFAADVDAEIAAMVWNAAVASYGGAGTYGQAVEDTLADTNELQVDDTPAAIAALAATLGVAGAGLTAIPWNAAWDAEVQSECTDALNAYDPPTKAELDAAQAAVTVSAIANNAITAAAIATDAIDADALKADAITEIQSGLATAAALTTVDTVVDLIEDILRNKMEILDVDSGGLHAGAIKLYADNGSDLLYTVDYGVTDDLTTTTRLRLA